MPKLLSQWVITLKTLANSHRQAVYVSMKLSWQICAGGSISIALGQKSPAMHIPSQAPQSPMRPADSAPHPIQSTEPLSSSIPDAFPMTAAMSAPATDMPTMEKVCSLFLVLCLDSLSHQIHGWYDQSTFPLMCCSLCCLQVVMCVKLPTWADQFGCYMLIIQTEGWEAWQSLITKLYEQINWTGCSSSVDHDHSEHVGSFTVN